MVKVVKTRYIYGDSGANYRRRLPCPFCKEKVYNTEFEHHVFGYSSGKPPVCAGSRNAYPKGMTINQFKVFLVDAIKKANEDEERVEDEEQSSPVEPTLPKKKSPEIKSIPQPAAPASKKRGRPTSVKTIQPETQKQEEGSDDDLPDLPDELPPPKKSSPPKRRQESVEETKQPPKTKNTAAAKTTPVRTKLAKMPSEPQKPQPALVENFDIDEGFEELFGGGEVDRDQPSTSTAHVKKSTNKSASPSPVEEAAGPSKAPTTESTADKKTPNKKSKPTSSEIISVEPMLPANFLTQCGLCGQKVATPTLLYLPCCYRQATCLWCVIGSSTKPGGALKCNACKFSMVPPSLD